MGLHQSVCVFVEYHYYAGKIVTHLI